MSREPVERQDDPRLSEYHQLAQPNRLAARGLFVAESRHVVRSLVSGGRFRLCSVLLTEKAAEELADPLGTLDPSIPIFVAPRSLFEGLAGFQFHRGCLAIAERGTPVSRTGLIEAAREKGGRLVVLDRVADPDNVGSIFRNAQAFGAAGVLLVGGGDPLYRKAVRVSLGATLEVPFAIGPDWAAIGVALREAGYTGLAAVADRDATPAAELSERYAERLVALVLGAEGAGLCDEALAHCDARTTVPMAPGFDSLNVATASGILLHHLARLP